MTSSMGTGAARSVAHIKPYIYIYIHRINLYGTFLFIKSLLYTNATLLPILNHSITPYGTFLLIKPFLYPCATYLFLEQVVYVIISLLMYFASEHKQRIVYDMVVTSLMLVMCGGIAMHIIDDSFMLGILTFALTLIALRARVYGTKKVSKWIGL